MSKQARVKQSRPGKTQTKRQLPRNAARWHSPIMWGAAAIAAVGLLLALALSNSKQPQPASARVSSGPAPAFSERDVTTGSPISSSGLRGRDVLLFFSEGVMCQACFEQIQSLEKHSAELRQRGLTLINITTDPPDALRQAVREYDIKTPMISDESRAMSRAYGAVGQGMHPDTDGHTFVLVDRSGHVRWRRDYATMYVPPEQLFAAVPQVR